MSPDIQIPTQNGHFLPELSTLFWKNLVLLMSIYLLHFLMLNVICTFSGFLTQALLRLMHLPSLGKIFIFMLFSPFILISRVLRKIINDEAEGILIVPWWPSQSWFPLFRRLLIFEPLLLHLSKSLLFSPFRNHHPSFKTLSLGAAKLSGKHLKAA